MTTSAIDPAQPEATTARLAGIMYVLTIFTASFADFYVRRQLFLPIHPSQTLRNIATSGMVVRVGIACDLITILGSVILAVALYRIFRPVDKGVALVAVFWWLLECSVAAVMTMTTLAALFFVNGRDFLRAINTYPTGTVAQLFLSADRAGNRIAGVLFGLGAALFCYLWFKSRYIPRPLAAWGFLSSLVPILAQLATIMVPSLMEVPIRRARSGWPILSFEVIIGLWLCVKGTRVSTTE